MKRLLLLGLITVPLIVLNWLYGNAVSVFITVAITASVIYYLLQIGFENFIQHKVSGRNISDDEMVKYARTLKRFRMLLPFAILTLVFITSIITIKRTADPGGRQPWFLNNEYHGLSNSGIAFNKSLQLFLPHQGDSNKNAYLQLQTNEAGAAVNSHDFYEPIYKRSGDAAFAPVNLIFPKAINDQFEIANGHNKISFTKKEKEQNFLRRLWNGKQYEWVLNITCNEKEWADEENIPLPFTTTARIDYQPLKVGMSLYRYVLNAKGFQAEVPVAYSLADRILQQLGNTYLLAAQIGNDEAYYLFPDKNFIENQYGLSVNSVKIKAQTRNTFQLNYEDEFYIGFNQKENLCRLQQLDKNEFHVSDQGKMTALVFDFPPVYAMTSPATEQKAGTKNIRFITNDEDVVIESPRSEGFYFNNFNLASPARISAQIDYVALQPNTPMQLNLQDMNGKSKTKTVTDGKFSLQSSDSGIQYLFTLRDFSINGFSHNKLLLFASLLYLSFLFVLLRFPGKNLGRVETILFVVVYTLLILRFLLYWRLATFPPLENITKYELENTLLQFDYRFIIKWPLPLTLVWTWLFLAVLVWWRWQLQKGKEYSWAKVEDGLTNTFYKIYNGVKNKLGFLHLPEWSQPQPYQKVSLAYVLFLVLCLFVFYCNKALIHQDAIVRVVSILFPLLAYSYASTKANKVFTFNERWATKANAFHQLKSLFHYFISNPAFIITLATIIYYALTDRGFAILFTLFILLKNILLNLLKKPFSSERTTIWKMLFKPVNYWIYGFIALGIYLFVLYFKSLFYYLLTYKLFVAWIVLAIPVLLYQIFYRSHKWLRHASTLLLALYTVLLLLPPTHQWMDKKASNFIRHVQYRASIIHQPISKLLEENPYSSFQTQKIIETAENQWFINSYINNTFDRDKQFNLRAFSKVGVNYNTQTRDVVVARFVIGEWGNFTMNLILLLCLLPLLVYLLSFTITDKKFYHRLVPSTYAGLIPLLLFFTLALFVWLTSTNRFVFFGQDFPFLSLTSRLSVVMPLALIAISLLQIPAVPETRKMQLQANTLRYAFLFVMIGLFAFTTFKKNELNRSYFSVEVEKTKNHIEKDFNAVLDKIQDSLANKHKRASYTSLLHMVAKDDQFKQLMDDQFKDAYTKSIFKQLLTQPSSAFKINNPLYIQYDNGRYRALYNEYLYMRLPIVESRNLWHGTIHETINSTAGDEVLLSYNGSSRLEQAPYFKSDLLSSIEVGILPASWTINNQPVAIVNLLNTVKNKSEVFIYKDQDRNLIQTAAGYASSLRNKDVATVKSGQQNIQVSISNGGREFANNKWVNGTYRVIYPMRENNFWVLHLAEAMRGSIKDSSEVNKALPITLDYNLHHDVQQLITKQYSNAQRKNNRFKFTAVAADGDGNIRLMASHVTNRLNLDPNDKAQLDYLRSKHFFYSNVRNERDQWGNANLLNMQMGPGSSIKPLVAGLNASQVNAGWQNLFMVGVAQAEQEYYAGYKLIRPWKRAHELPVPLISLSQYIEASSNYYQSIMMFLGSYPKAAFMKGSTASLNNILQRKAGKNNSFPLMQYNSSTYALPNFSTQKSLWPVTDAQEKKKTTFFGNENSILSEAFEINANLRTRDQDKNDLSPFTYAHARYMDSANYALIGGKNSTAYIWCFPEQSSFLQSQRAYTDRSENFNLGLKTATLGGYPYKITPAKMLEMYMALLMQNRDFRLHFTPDKNSYTPWHIDSSWGTQQTYHQFLAQYIFKGMHDVIHGGSGTATGRLSGWAKAHNGLYFYGKTGTINEEGAGSKDSRRLIVCVSNKDLNIAENIGARDTKLYGWYFTIDNNRDFDWDVLKAIMDKTMNAASFKKYFQR